MANENEGYMDGSYYYSAALPQGAGDKTVYNKEESDIITKVLNPTSPNITPDDVLAAQKLMIKLGYLDPGMDDGMVGPITMGAARRYQSNTNTSAIFDVIKGKFDSFFGD